MPEAYSAVNHRDMHPRCGRLSREASIPGARGLPSPFTKAAAGLASVWGECGW